MQLTLEIDPAKLGAVMEDTFATLTAEQRFDLCKQAMWQWLTDPKPVEDTLRRTEAIEYVKRNDYDFRDGRYRGNGQPIPLEEYQKSRCYREYLEKHPTSREIMLTKVRDAVIADYTACVRETIANDPRIQEAKEKVLALVVENFPKIAHDAMIMFFASNLDRVISRSMYGVMASIKESDGNGNTRDVPVNLHIQHEINQALEKISSEGKISFPR